MLAAEALPEVEESVENFRIAAEDVKRLETPIIPARDPNKKLFTFKEPIGTWAIITPWNFQFAVPLWMLGPSLLEGNTAVFKPSEDTPAIGQRLVELFEEAGFPQLLGRLLNPLSLPRDIELRQASWACGAAEDAKGRLNQQRLDRF